MNYFIFWMRSSKAVPIHYKWFYWFQSILLMYIRKVSCFLYFLMKIEFSLGIRNIRRKCHMAIFSTWFTIYELHTLKLDTFRRLFSVVTIVLLKAWHYTLDGVGVSRWSNITDDDTCHLTLLHYKRYLRQRTG